MKSVQILNDELMLVARLLLASVFVLSVIGKLTGFSGQVAWVGSMYPIPEVLLVCAIVLELVGVVTLITGWHIKWGCYALILFVVAANLMFHLDFSTQLNTFLKNLGLIGGLMLLSASKPGKYSL